MILFILRSETGKNKYVMGTIRAVVVWGDGRGDWEGAGGNFLG